MGPGSEGPPYPESTALQLAQSQASHNISTGVSVLTLALKYQERPLMRCYSSRSLPVTRQGKDAGSPE